MKEFRARPVDKDSEIRSMYLSIVVSIIGLILANILRGFNIYVNLIAVILSGFAIYYVYFFNKEVVSACIINSESCLFLVKITRGKESKEIIIPFDSMSFVYQYEQQSQYAASPVLSIYDNKRMIAKLIVNKILWDEVVVKDMIKELSVIGIKGKVTKTDQAGTDLFEYIN